LLDPTLLAYCNEKMSLLKRKWVPWLVYWIIKLIQYFSVIIRFCHVACYN
jgi:hypothetical protein